MIYHIDFSTETVKVRLRSLLQFITPIVRRIFRMTLEGYGPYQIAAQLSNEHIPVLPATKRSRAWDCGRTGKLKIPANGEVPP